MEGSAGRHLSIVDAGELVRDVAESEVNLEEVVEPPESYSQSESDEESMSESESEE
jgi:hypothetical protein